jgi:PBP1b-binding outer membrane lipoprotein LpoB
MTRTRILAAALALAVLGTGCHQMQPVPMKCTKIGGGIPPHCTPLGR